MRTPEENSAWAAYGLKLGVEAGQVAEDLGMNLDAVLSLARSLGIKVKDSLSDQIRPLVLEGLSNPQIVDRLHCSYGLVVDIRRELKNYPDFRNDRTKEIESRLDGGETQAGIARSVGVTPSYVNHLQKRRTER